MNEFARFSIIGVKGGGDGILTGWQHIFSCADQWLKKRSGDVGMLMWINSLVTVGNPQGGDPTVQHESWILEGVCTWWGTTPGLIPQLVRELAHRLADYIEGDVFLLMYDVSGQQSSQTVRPTSPRE
jgi:hypothetical protein